MLRLSKIFSPRNLNVPGSDAQFRGLWWWTVQMFNAMDAERTKSLGYDRTAAEWLLRNGACAKFVGYPTTFCDYNVLPPENQKFQVKEIEAENAGINDDGFIHLKGCEKLDRVALSNCAYITDEALSRLDYRKNSLKVLEISGCKNITVEGLRYLSRLTGLEKLVIRNLPDVKDPAKIADELRQTLKNCDIDIK